MLLSIDRVLQLVSEGKDIVKISEMAQCTAADVSKILDDARNLLSKYEKVNSRRKIVIKKKKVGNLIPEEDTESKLIRDIFSGAELAAIPVDSPLTMYVGGVSKGNPGKPGDAGIGIVIFDREDRQVGKVSAYIGIRTPDYTEQNAFLRALKIAAYFQTSELKIRTDSEIMVKQLNGEYKINNPEFQKFFDAVSDLKEKLRVVRIEHVSKSQNDKAVYFANKASEKHK